MKRKLLKITLVSCVALFAQGSSAQTFFARGGMNVSNINYIKGDGTQDNSFTSKVGFQIGGGADLALGDNMGVEASLLFTLRGTNFSMSETDPIQISSEGEMNLNYIDIPINFRYSAEVGDGKLNIYLGPKLGIGLNGNFKGETKMTYLGNTGTTSYDNKVSFGSSDTNDFKTLDLSLGFGIGYEIEKFHIVASYNYGLTNHIHKPVDKESVLQNMFAITLGYRFNEE